MKLYIPRLLVIFLFYITWSVMVAIFCPILCIFYITAAFFIITYEAKLSKEKCAMKGVFDSICYFYLICFKFPQRIQREIIKKTCSGIICKVPDISALLWYRHAFPRQIILIFRKTSFIKICTMWIDLFHVGLQSCRRKYTTNITVIFFRKFTKVPKNSTTSLRLEDIY